MAPKPRLLTTAEVPPAVLLNGSVVFAKAGLSRVVVLFFEKGKVMSLRATSTNPGLRRCLVHCYRCQL